MFGRKLCFWSPSSIWWLQRSAGRVVLCSWLAKRVVYEYDRSCFVVCFSGFHPNGKTPWRNSTPSIENMYLDVTIWQLCIFKTRVEGSNSLATVLASYNIVICLYQLEVLGDETLQQELVSMQPQSQPWAWTITICKCLLQQDCWLLSRFGAAQWVQLAFSWILKTFVDFGLHERGRTTSALLRTRAHFCAHERAVKNCSFANFVFRVLQLLKETLWSLNAACCLIYFLWPESVLASSLKGFLCQLACTHPAHLWREWTP